MRCVEILGEATRIAFSTHAIAGCNCELCEQIRKDRNESGNIESSKEESPQKEIN